jgi:hypothetical protein
MAPFLNEVPREDKFIEAESQMVVSRRWREGGEE